VRAYLWATSRSVLARYWQQRACRRVGALPEDLAEISSCPDARPAAAQQVGQILATLPARYRRILELRFLDDRTVAEAARILDISVPNAKVLQHRALRRAAQIPVGTGM
jgi:RNA polymerase sigma factor (sigma-70 family)